MTHYQVFENDKPCSSYNIKGWEQDTFSSFEAAQEFAVKWCYPCQINNYKEWPHPTELNTPVNMSHCEYPVMMEIRGVS